jgi:guanosine-3',5'-bis(diphosphate) 3'-pyrophosphohydrolase
MGAPDAVAAMNFARAAHTGHVRKYTGNPYADHLAEVAGIVATVAPFGSMRLMVSVAWLHDCVEDVGVTLDQIKAEFGPEVAQGVAGLSDLEVGNRAERKAASRARLAACDGWIQTIKVADLISNTSSIVMHDPKFAETYLAEKRALLDVLTRADERLVVIANRQACREPDRDR